MGKDSLPALPSYSGVDPSALHYEDQKVVLLKVTPNDLGSILSSSLLNLSLSHGIRPINCLLSYVWRSAVVSLSSGSSHKSTLCNPHFSQLNFSYVRHTAYQNNRFSRRTALKNGLRRSAFDSLSCGIRPINCLSGVRPDR